MLESSFHDPLSAQINVSTRSHHVILNRLITSRLPFCLPPNTSGPQVYATGIAQFAEIFYAFEEFWDQVTGVDRDNKALEDTWESLDEQYPSGTAVDLISLLRTLRPHGLARSARIRKDMAYLQTMQGGEDSIVGRVKSKAVEDFITHIRSTVQENPHLLIAYAWTLYMAIFSGGRWVRAQLCSAGEGFWTSSTSTSIPTASIEDKEKVKLTLEDLKTFEPLGLSLWFFPTETDGEDIRVEFKRRLQDGEHILTSTQRDEIVKESQGIFERFQDMVADLDAAFGEAPRAVSTQHDQKQAPLKMNVVQSNTGKLLFNMPSYAGLALVVSCVSWYAMYHAGTWS